MAEQAHRTRRGFFALILLLLFFLTSFCFQAVLPAGVPVVHVVRHPAMILRSAVQLGWYIDPVIRYTVTEPLSSPVAPFHSPVETYLERICRSMLDNHNIIAQHPNTPAITVRLEDIVNNFRPTMAEVLAHLNIPLSDAALSRLEQESETRAADLPPFFLQDVLTIDHALQLVRNYPTCATALELFGYY
eukprot:m.249844 g.249844  ORF g.249844 m.249844 type:complete len:189 (+) comp54502_c1_seq10:486-1052(+)